MNQWIIDRYNKGQEEYMLFDEFQNTLEKQKRRGSILSIGFKDYKKNRKDIVIISIYDFLFNPAWRFAKAFWGDWYCLEEERRVIPKNSDDATESYSNVLIWQYLQTH